MRTCCSKYYHLFLHHTIHQAFHVTCNISITKKDHDRQQKVDWSWKATKLLADQHLANWARDIKGFQKVLNTALLAWLSTTF